MFRKSILSSLIAFAFVTGACGVEKQDPTSTAIDNVVSTEDIAEGECAGGDCDDVTGSATFCTGNLVCHSFVKGFRMPTRLPNGQHSCPPGFTLKPLTPPNTGRVDACDAANAFAWPLPCEIGCYGDVINLPVAPTINGGCCSYDYTRDCKPLPMCTADPALLEEAAGL